MPSRRVFLGCVGAASVVGAGCTALPGSNGRPVRFGTLDDPDGEIVARTARVVNFGDEWTFNVDALVHEREGGRLALMTFYRILSETNSNEWEYTGMDEVHDWTVGPASPILHDMDSNAEPVDDDMAQGRYRNQSASDVGRWMIRLPSASSSSITHQFVTDISDQVVPEAGDLLVESRPTFYIEESGFIADADQHEITLQLVYGEINE